MIVIEGVVAVRYSSSLACLPHVFLRFAASTAHIVAAPFPLPCWMTYVAVMISGCQLQHTAWIWVKSCFLFFGSHLENEKMKEK